MCCNYNDGVISRLIKSSEDSLKINWFPLSMKYQKIRLFIFLVKNYLSADLRFGK